MLVEMNERSFFFSLLLLGRINTRIMRKNKFCSFILANIRGRESDSQHQDVYQNMKFVFQPTILRLRKRLYYV